MNLMNNHITEGLVKTLEEASIKQEAVETIGDYNRAIGKTTALIKFAKKYDFYVVVPSKIIATHLSNEFNYNKITPQSNFSYVFDGYFSEMGNESNVVFDENVDVPLLRKKGLNVVTGFYNTKL